MDEVDAGVPCVSPLRTAKTQPPFTIHHLPFTIYHSPFTIHHPPSHRLSPLPPLCYIRSAMRIIAGQFRGRVLKSPPSMNVRPTSDRLRETLFNVIARRVEGARFLDLCAGSGDRKSVV